MATLVQVLVQMTFTLWVFPIASNSKNSTATWLLNVRQTEGIGVDVKGHLYSSTAHPTLYNLFRVQTYHQGLLSPVSFTLESMATNTFICMDPKGNLITKARVTDFPQTGSRKQKRSPPSNRCIFRSWAFGSVDWNQMVGIYMDAPRSNGTKGLFMAFNKNGQPRRYRRHFSKLTKSLNMLITMHKPTSLRKLIRRTRFERCDGVKASKKFNRTVRRCLETEPDLLLVQKIQRKNLFKIIHRCQKEAEGKVCLKRSRRRSRGQIPKRAVNDGEDESCHCLQ